jgi:hypothetical protein
MTHALRDTFAHRWKQNGFQISVPGAVYNQQDLRMTQMKKMGDLNRNIYKM